MFLWRCVDISPVLLRAESNHQTPVAFPSQILGIDRFDTRTNTATIYVTDWTRNAWLRQEMTSVRVERQSERRASQGRRFVLRSALKGMLLPIVLHDVFAEISVMFQVGQLYRLRNLPLSYRVSNEYGHLKGEMKTWHEWKLIDVQEVPRSSQDRDVVELSRYVEPWP